MRGITTIVARALTAALIILLLFACGHGQRASFAPQLGDVNEPAASITAADVTWPMALPQDALQPWERVDGSGRVVSSINLDSQFVPGVERFSDAGEVADLGEAASFASGAPGAEAVSYAIYRIPLGSGQPGTIAADVNLHGGGSYYLGVADYSADTWRWHGPFSVSHVRVSLPHYEYTSTLGNLFVAVVAYDGAAFDLVGLGVNARDDADSIAPSIPEAPTLTPVAGGLHVRWLQVDEEDLAGYRVYADGKEALGYVEGGTSVVIPATAETEITLTAVDLSGNESEASEASTDSPLAGDIPTIELTTSAASGGRNAVIGLTASGAETYDWDVDGDGTFDITGDTSGTATASTASYGIIRPALRGHTADGGFSLSAVSLIIAGNSRPVVMATADVTSGPPPLDVNFTIVAEDDDGTIDEYAWDFDGDGTFDDSLPTDPSPLAHSYADAGMYNAKFRATDNDGAWAVDTVSISTLSLAPVASLTVTPDEVILGIGDTPPDVMMDGSASTDPEGGPLEFSFDFYGDNSFSFYQSDPTYMDFYPNPGKYEPTLRVRDVGGLVSEISRFVNVYRFSSMVVDDTSFTGEYTSIFDLNGFPSIFYYDADAGDLRFVRAGYKDGSYWDEPETVDGKDADVGRFASVAVVNGRPAIAYYDATKSDLKYVRAENTTGTSWGTPRVLDTAGSVGTQPSLAVVNGNPAVSYYDNSNNNLKFVRANDADGASWGAPMTVDSKNGTGDYNSLAVVNGNPAIAYNDWGDGDLRYIQATDANGASWGTPVVVESATEGRYASMAVVNGNPAIGYYMTPGSDLNYVRAIDANGSAWGAPVTADGTGSTGRYASLNVVNGNPAISYQYSTASDLYYVRATNANGTAWGAPFAVDTAGAVGPYTSLYVVNGNPAISYYDETNFDLKYARATNADGSAWAAPVTAYSTGIVGQYTSMTVAAGNPVIAYFDITGTRLLLARSTDADGTAWNSYVADPGDYNFGEYASGAAVGGHPAVAYCDSWNGDLRFCRASDEAGTSWGYSVILDCEGNVGDYASLAIVASNPAVAYQDRSFMYLKYVRATDPTGTNWGSPIVVDNGAGNAVGQYSSLAVVNGNPAISYIDSSDYDLLYIRATDSAGATWGTRVIVVSDDDVGEYSSMAVINGSPAIVYTDTTNNQLEFVIANDANGSTWGAPVVVVDGVSTGDTVRLGERDGRPVIIYGDSSDDDLCYVEALNSSGTVWKQLKKVDTKGYVGEYASFIVTKEGLPLIAYHDSDGYLKFATLRLY